MLEKRRRQAKYCAEPALLAYGLWLFHDEGARQVDVDASQHTNIHRSCASRVAEAVVLRWDALPAMA